MLYEGGFMDQGMTKLLKDVVNSSFGELIDLGTKCLNNAHKYLDDDELENFTWAVAKAFISADGECTRKEFELFRAITGYDGSTDYFYNMTNNGRDPDFLNTLYKALNVIDYDAKRKLLLFGIIITAADGTISSDEIALIDAMTS